MLNAPTVPMTRSFTSPDCFPFIPKRTSSLKRCIISITTMLSENIHLYKDVPPGSIWSLTLLI